jgi:hypothetical protein
MFLRSLRRSRCAVLGFAIGPQELKMSGDTGPAGWLDTGGITS